MLVLRLIIGVIFIPKADAILKPGSSSHASDVAAEDTLLDLRLFSPIQSSSATLSSGTKQ